MPARQHHPATNQRRTPTQSSRPTSPNRQFARALIQRDAETDPAAKMSRSARLKTKPGVYTSCYTREDCVAVLDALDAKMDEVLGSECRTNLLFPSCKIHSDKVDRICGLPNFSPY